MITVAPRLQVALLTLCAAWSISCLAENAPNLPEGFLLSDKKWFVNDIDSTNCGVLHHEGQSYGYVSVAGIAGDSLLVEKCYDNTETDFVGMRGSGWVEGWFLASPGNEDLIPLEMEALDRFSCPSTCGDIIAYWVANGSSDRETGDEYFAYLADLSTQRVVLKHFLGKARIGGTDWRWHLPVPEWNEDCSEVLYQHEPHIKPVRIDLQGDDDRTVPPGAEDAPRFRGSKMVVSSDGEVSNLPEGISVSDPIGLPALAPGGARVLPVTDSPCRELPRLDSKGPIPPILRRLLPLRQPLP